MASGTLVIILGLTIIYGLINGLHGSAIIVATMISSRAVHPRLAILIAAFSVMAGPFLLGVAVATTIGADLIQPQATTPLVIISALIGAISWSGFTFWLKLPSSISHALIASIVGAVWAGFGLEAVQLSGLYKIFLALFLSPLLGLLFAFWAVRLTYFLSTPATPHINKWFNRGQVLVSILMGIAFGANDGQKMIAVLILGLLATNWLDVFTIPTWTLILSSATIGIGSLIGGWRLIHTLGGKFYKIRPIHGFGAQLASGFIIFGAGLWGGPVSGSQVVTSAIIGAGSADRIQKVRWGVVQRIFWGWILTIPFSASISAIIYQLFDGRIK